MVMIVYDPTSKESFQHVSSWLDSVAAANNGRKLPGMSEANTIKKISLQLYKRNHVVGVEKNMRYLLCG